MLKVKLNRPRQHATFGILPLSNQIFNLIRVVDNGNVWSDNPSFIEVWRDIMRRSSDQFNASFIGAVGVCSLKCGNWN